MIIIRWSTSIINITNSLDHCIGRGDPLRVTLLPNQLYFESVLEVVKTYLKDFKNQFEVFLLYFTNNTKIVIGT